jgi:hypothetical protein
VTQPGETVGAQAGAPPPPGFYFINTPTGGTAAACSPSFPRETGRRLETQKGAPSGAPHHFWKQLHKHKVA